jgi:hypothetical protein
LNHHQFGCNTKLPEKTENGQPDPKLLTTHLNFEPKALCCGIWRIKTPTYFNSLLHFDGIGRIWIWQNLKTNRFIWDLQFTLELFAHSMGADPPNVDHSQPVVWVDFPTTTHKPWSSGNPIYMQKALGS